MKGILSFFGWLCIACGIGSAIFAVVAFVDPAVVQAANDADPLAAPPARREIALHFLFSLVVTAIGVHMVKWKPRP